jgi:hypothetical protein
MRQGDLIRVRGRKNRDGVVVTRLVEILDRVDLPPRARVHSHLTFGYRTARAADIAAKIVSVVLALAIVGRLAGLLG